MGLYQQVERLEQAKGLDAFAEKAQESLRPYLDRRPVKDLLSGTWLGHPLHPLLVTVPIGSWVSAALLDLGGRGVQRAADRLIGFGALAALPTAAAGLSDWLDTVGAERRVGLVHAAGNDVALGLMVASWFARRRGRRGRGVLLSLLADGIVGVTGYLGGHLAYNQGVGVDTTAFQAGPQEWTAVAAEDELRENVPVAVSADDVTVLLVRRSGRVEALNDRCTHRGGPLHEGTLEGDCIVCPWHGSAFRLDDGTVARGPATQPEPSFEVRVVAGRVEVRRSELKGLRVNTV